MDEGVGPQERWERAKAFRDKAQEELNTGDRLRREVGGQAGSGYYALSLADAISASKESLHGFVTFTSGAFYDDYVSFPTLLREAARLGLSLGENAQALRRFNWIRNTRIHRQPGRVVTGAQANVALRTARSLDALVAGATAGKEPAAPVHMPARQSAAPSPVAMTSASSAPPGGVVPIPMESHTRPRRLRLFPLAWRLLAAIVLFAVGLACGIVANSPVFGSPLSFGPLVPAISRPPATPTSTVVATPPTAALQVVGSIAVTAPQCGAGQLSFQAHNLDSATPASVAVGSPDAPGATFALAPDTAGIPTLSTDVAAQSPVTVYVLNAPRATFSIDVLAPAGTVHLSATAC